MGKGMNEMTLKDEWDLLDAGTRTWLLDNPGCVIVPRTVTARIKQHSAGHIEVDGHGQMMFSREDLDFIHEKGTDVDAVRVGEVRFFDATQPGTGK
jgi:hypothetical protein